MQGNDSYSAIFYESVPLIRSLTVADAADCLDLWRLSRDPSDDRISFLENHLKQQVNCLHFGSFVDSRTQAIGWVTLGWIGDYGKLVGLLVRPEFRFRGIGRLLVRHIIEAAIDKRLVHVDLEVVSGNTNARKLYEKTGFKQIVSGQHSPLCQHYQQYRCFLPK
jgi:ribosomal protein S18 acetylase RimI-like enzyme